MNEVVLRLGPEPSSSQSGSLLGTEAHIGVPSWRSAPRQANAGRAFVLDVDADQAGPRAWLELQGARLSIATVAGQTALPSSWSRLEQPKIRSLDGRGFLLMDSLPTAAVNAWVFDSRGRLTKALEASGGLETAAFPGGVFAIGFHPGGAEANGYPTSALAETAGVGFYDAEGELLFALNDRLRSQRLEAHNILAMAPFGPSQLILIPESLLQGERVRDCPLMIYDWAKDRVDWWVSPFLDPLAVAGSGRSAFVFSPIGFDDEVMELDLETLETRSVGVCADIDRGLDHGLFLAQIDDSTFSVVNPSASLPFSAEPPHGLASENGSLLGSGLKNGDKRGRKNRARLEIVR